MKKCLSLLLACGCLFAFPMTAFAGQWKSDHVGWWYQNDNGSYPADCWQWIDGNNDGIAECYYFDQTGYLLTNTTTPDQYQVNADGAWIVNGIVQVKQLENTVNTITANSNCFVDLSTYFASDFASYDIMRQKIGIDSDMVWWNGDWSVGSMGQGSGESNVTLEIYLTNRADDYTLTYDVTQVGSPLMKIEGKVGMFFHGVPNEDDYPADELARLARKAGADVEVERKTVEVADFVGSKGTTMILKPRLTERVNLTIYHNGYQYTYSSGDYTSKYVTVTKY